MGQGKHGCKPVVWLYCPAGQAPVKGAESAFHAREKQQARSNVQCRTDRCKQPPAWTGSRRGPQHSWNWRQAVNASYINFNYDANPTNRLRDSPRVKAGVCGVSGNHLDVANGPIAIADVEINLDLWHVDGLVSNVVLGAGKPLVVQKRRIDPHKRWGDVRCKK